MKKWEIWAIVGVIFAVILTVVLVVVFVVIKPGQDSGATQGVVLQNPENAGGSLTPTPAPTLRENYGYQLIKAASPQVEWPGDPLALQDMIAAGSSGSMYVFPQYRAANFVLYEDLHPARPGSPWFLQRYGLFTLWLTLGGDGGGWTNEWNWAASANVCDSFYGLECDLAQEHVTKLDLGKNGLSTTKPNQVGAIEGIPYELSTLTEATVVELDDNDIGGPIPTKAIMDMKKLTTATFKRNRLTGNIPVDLASSSLTFLSLDENSLVGDVSEEFCPIYCMVATTTCVENVCEYLPDVEKENPRPALCDEEKGITTVVVNCQVNDCFCCRGPFCE